MLRQAVFVSSVGFAWYRVSEGENGGKVGADVALPCASLSLSRTQLLFTPRHIPPGQRRAATAHLCLRSRLPVEDAGCRASPVSVCVMAGRGTLAWVEVVKKEKRRGEWETVDANSGRSEPHLSPSYAILKYASGRDSRVNILWSSGTCFGWGIKDSRSQAPSLLLVRQPAVARVSSLVICCNGSHVRRPARRFACFARGEGTRVCVAFGGNAEVPPLVLVFRRGRCGVVLSSRKPLSICNGRPIPR